MEHNVAIRFDSVSFSHREVDVLRNTSFHVHENEFVALVGPNGAGKTTLLRLVMGLAVPASGKVEVFGKSPRSVQASIGYVPQYMNFDSSFPISVEEVVKMGRLVGLGRGCMEKQCADVDTALELAEVADLRKRSYAALSGGQRRRVLVARALASNPRLLILDEPTANMDVESEKRLYTVLGNLKKTATILIATHDTGFVSALTDVVLCVTEDGKGSHHVVRHASVPAEDVPVDLYGSHVVRILHDTDLPDDICCGTEQQGATR